MANRYEVGFWADGNVLGLDSGDSCPALSVY